MYDLNSQEFKALPHKEKVAIWRDLGSRNELTAEHMIEAIKHLREDRLNIPEKVKKERVTKASQEKALGANLLADLKGQLGLDIK